jgi:hypothetical protein
MTDTLTHALTTTRRFNIRRLHMPRLGIAEAIVSVIPVVGDAYGSAYTAPFTCCRSKAATPSDEDLEGRDPSW